MSEKKSGTKKRFSVNGNKFTNKKTNLKIFIKKGSVKKQTSKI